MRKGSVNSDILSRNVMRVFLFCFVFVVVVFVIVVFCLFGGGVFIFK